MNSDHSSDTPPPIQGIHVLRKYAETMPAASGVYRMMNSAGDIMYIGKAKRLKHRVSSYLNIGQLPLRLQRMVSQITAVEITLTASEAEALLLESTLIKEHQPKFNILLKDDKSFPYILFSDEPYPRISKYRGSKTKEGAFFGPFISAGAVEETLTLLQKAFLLRPCKDTVFRNRTRPCLQYQIKRCSAPCVKQISEEEYAKTVKQAQDFLRGAQLEMREALTREMEAASAAMDYEKAASLRDRIRAITQVQHQQSITAVGLDDADVLVVACESGQACVQIMTYRCGQSTGGRSYFPAHTEDCNEPEILEAFIGQFYAAHQPPKQILVSHLPNDIEVLKSALAMRAGHAVQINLPQRGEKTMLIERALMNARDALRRHLQASTAQTELLAKVADLFGVEGPIERVEVYDNSHVMGAHAIGAMIVATPDGFNKKAYRQFNIKSQDISAGDDYGMLREVFTRRFKRLMSEEEEGNSANRPDLVLIDGGAGQLSSATQIFEELGIDDIPYVAISKGPDRNAGREWFHMPGRAPFQLPANDPVLHYLQRLRDEAHRFAIGTHRKKRSSNTLVSELDKIASIGPKRKKALLLHFGSSRGVSAASIEQLMNVPGINAETAKVIYGHFHGD